MDGCSTGTAWSQGGRPGPVCRNAEGFQGSQRGSLAPSPSAFSRICCRAIVKSARHNVSQRVVNRGGEGGGSERQRGAGGSVPICRNPTENLENLQGRTAWFRIPRSQVQGFKLGFATGSCLVQGQMSGSYSPSWTQPKMYNKLQTEGFVRARTSYSRARSV